MAYQHNQTTLVGRVTKDPEYKSFGEVKKTNFTLAVERNYKNKKGEKQVDFINVSTWGKLATLSSNYLRKGTPVLVSGRIQVRSYEKDNQKFWRTEVIADNFEILENKSKVA